MFSLTINVLSIFSANIGGLLGLFMGFSVFSIIEILYFLSIRPYCRYLRDSEKRRQVIQNLTQRIQNFRSKRTTSTSRSNESTIMVENAIFPQVNWYKTNYVLQYQDWFNEKGRPVILPINGFPN